jgi:hypothetical protein
MRIMAIVRVVKKENNWRRKEALSKGITSKNKRMALYISANDSAIAIQDDPLLSRSLALHDLFPAKNSQ